MSESEVWFSCRESNCFAKFPTDLARNLHEQNGHDPKAMSTQTVPGKRVGPAFTMYATPLDDVGRFGIVEPKIVTPIEALAMRIYRLEEKVRILRRSWRSKGDQPRPNRDLDTCSTEFVRIADRLEAAMDEARRRAREQGEAFVRPCGSVFAVLHDLIDFERSQAKGEAFREAAVLVRSDGRGDPKVRRELQRRAAMLTMRAGEERDA